MATAANPFLKVFIEPDSPSPRELRFRESFRIGRVEECAVCIQNDYVSRNHAEVVFENGQWWIRDLASRNGLFIDGERQPLMPLSDTRVRLGIQGPFLRFLVETPKSTTQLPSTDQPVGDATMVARYIDHYFKRPETQPETIGEHTRLVRQAFSQVQKKKERRYHWLLAALGALLLIVGAFAIYQHRQVSQQKAMASDLFYSMRALDVDIASLEQIVLNSENRQGLDRIRNQQARRKELEANYDNLIDALHVYDSKVTPEERLILRVTRIFGECEIAIPPDFLSEVKSYIKRWQGSPRLARAIRTARQNNYHSFIAKELLAQNLPPQFFYLALQESDFDAFISGPMTYKGVAKGMWQFIPETGAKYGLKIGPLADFRRPDPADDRHHWDRATQAAARYLKDLYTTDAQASGFLVMACYNWGEGKVLPLVRSLPPNPKERNFWRLLALYKQKFPKETYDYVFYIVSAAIIGEDPKLFGFDFENPLAHLETQ